MRMKLKVANRTYPLNVQLEEEASLRNASKRITQMMEELEKAYAVSDTQDLLAMTALQFANQVIAEEGKVKIDDDGLGEQIDELEASITDYLKNC